MNDLSPHLRAAFERDLQSLPVDRFPNYCTQYIDVLKAHYYICDFFEAEGNDGRALFGIKNMDMLCSAVSRQIVEFGGVRKWTDEFAVAATLFWGLIKDHAFHDGNKRTALLVLIDHLRRLGRMPMVPQKEFEKLTIAVAESDWQSILGGRRVDCYTNQTDLHDAVILEIARKLRKMTRQREGRYRPITYYELERGLSKFGYFFRDPHRNTIDVYKKERHKILGISTKRIDEIKVMNIAFPGWKRQVTKETVKEILKRLKLDSKSGHDWATVFGDAEPLYKLVQDYEGPLSRLRDK